MVGKPIGVVVISVLAIRLRLACLPVGLSLRHLVLVGVTAGIGFTIAACLSLILGATLLHRLTKSGLAQTADEAECSTES